MPRVRNGRDMGCQTCRCIRERDANAVVNILICTIQALIIGATGQTGRQTAEINTLRCLLGEAIANPCITRQHKIMFSDILRLLEAVAQTQAGVCRGRANRGARIPQR